MDLGLPFHILINNAGILNLDFELTEDGYENHFGINHLGHFALTTTLLERIRESAPARILVLSLMAHEIPSFKRPIDFKSLRVSTVQANNIGRYGQSKLANILFAKALARRLRDKIRSGPMSSIQVVSILGSSERSLSLMIELSNPLVDCG
ncbi:Retinol dehydrogenase 12 [Mortierella sp. GBA30]|nr:Retinol dehydrogenase 12 [Mortierella sp. GBA30]